MIIIIISLISYSVGLLSLRLLNFIIISFVVVVVRNGLTPSQTTKSRARWSWRWLRFSFVFFSGREASSCFIIIIHFVYRRFRLVFSRFKHDLFYIYYYYNYNFCVFASIYSENKKEEEKKKRFRASLLRL